LIAYERLSMTARHTLTCALTSRLMMLPLPPLPPLRLQPSSPSLGVAAAAMTLPARRAQAAHAA
jgi:hypothetical protein